MPNIHVEDKWWTDQRRYALMEAEGENLADGTAVGAWLLAAWFVKYENKLYVPIERFVLLKGHQSLLRVGLAVRIGDGEVYIKGSKDLYCKS